MQVVDRDERKPPRPGERLRRREPDEEGADQPGPARDGDGLDVVERGAGARKRFLQHGADQLQMAPRGDLGDDAAVTTVQFRLGSDDVRQDATVARDESDGGLVAGRLDPEDHPSAAPASSSARIGSFHMISASSRLSV